MRTALLGAAAFAGGLWIAVAAAQQPTVAVGRTPRSHAVRHLAREQVAPLPGRSICAGGMEGPVRFEIVPDRTVATGGGEVLDYSVRSENRTGQSASARYAIELVTDRGVAITPPAAGNVFDVGPGASRSDSHSTPPGLADGFYILRVTAAAATASNDSTDVVHLYFEVAGGHIYQLDTEEFYGRSRANEGVAR